MTNTHLRSLDRSKGTNVVLCLACARKKKRFKTTISIAAPSGFAVAVAFKRQTLVIDPLHQRMIKDMSVRKLGGRHPTQLHNVP